jgi:hypothetical protein
MVMYEAGMLARSKAGHDKAQMYIIKEVDDMYIWWMAASEHSAIRRKRRKSMYRSFTEYII